MRSRFRRGLLEGVTRQRAREMRKSLTAAKKLLWARLRRRYIGLKFRRQYPLLGFFPDFCCLERRLIVEIDGDSHAERPQYDAWRSEQLAQRGFRVLRFFNDEVQNNLDGVIEAIYEAMQAPADTPSLTLPRVKQRGRG
ncbi:MAG: endonuclease domain-containing protein [Deltaproteobacteria bacterium]|nr:endonuclease domain-containing protein [Deltaproteobacteria bacterium]